MGRSVSSPSNTAALCFRDVSWVGQKTDPETGEETGEYCQDQASCDWGFIVNNFRRQLQERGFDEADEWLDREDHVLAASEHFKAGISEYCGCASLWLVPQYEDPEEMADYGVEPMEPLREAALVAWFAETFGEMRKVGTFSNGEAVFEKT